MSDLRTAAARLSTAGERYDEAARRLATRTAGLPGRWSGAAADAALDRLHELPRRALEAADAHARAADVLLVCAARVKEAQATEHRAQALDSRADAELFGDPLRLQAARLRAQAEADVRDALRQAAAELHALADEAPDPLSPRLSAVDQLTGFGRAAVDATWGTVVTAAQLSPPRMLVDFDGWRGSVGDLLNGMTYALRHPREAVSAVAGADQLREGRYGEWAGALVPDLLSGAFTGGAAPAARRGLDVADDLAEVADDVHDLQRVHRVADAGGPVEARPGAQLPDGYVPVIRDLTPERRTHILDGDARGGGHRSGTGRPKKTEFPSHWTDDDIIRRVMETARSPQSGSWNGKHDKFNVTADYDGVTVLVSVNRRGEVRTAYPLPGGRGVVSNP